MNISDIIEKIKYKENLKFEKEIANLFNISPSDYSNRKQRSDSLIHLIVKWGIEKNVDLNWLIKGGREKEPRTAQKNTEGIEKRDTLTEAIIAIEEWLAESGTKITPEEKAHLIKKLVEKLKC
ncbi:MAG: hypothetical protein B6245_03465 [Desulfobacteraceae bacterium 4572_88]|nr:MAG: hypothetical protein B6245_03465 [Desulfobacteraceae bacterium 4572_88]